MSGYVLKSPGSELQYALDWRQGYLENGEKVVDDLGWRVLPIETIHDLNVVSQHVDQAASHVKVAGGVPGRTYMVCARVLTSAGRELERAVVMQIAS